MHSKNTTKVILDRLTDLLMVSSGYYERLTHIKNSLLSIEKDFNVTYSDAKLLIYKYVKVEDLRIKDQESVQKLLLKDFIKFEHIIVNDLLIINNTMSYVDKVQFNIKSILSIMKTRLEVSTYKQRSE